ncbi:2-isopropylmalate synthase [Candidatus Woesearchaeota archaeon]|nr:2-isopropylmalate synthase [Candidatus Woesearchaeota archaeon]
MEHQRDKNQVYIFDTTNRDGEQATEGAKHGIPSKLEIVAALENAHVDRIEAGFPISSDQDFEAVQSIAQSSRESMIFGLARVPIEKTGKIIYDDIDTAFGAVRDANFRGIHTFSVNFDDSSLEHYGYSREEVLQGAVRGVAHARKLLGDQGQVEFSFQCATIAPLDEVVKGYLTVIEAGANVINVPDTIGYSHPDEISLLITTLRREVPEDVMISIHCHNDLGLAVANSLAAVKAGADIIECTVNGIGERAGNAALEEVVMNIKTRPDLFGGRTVGVDTSKLNELSALVSHHYEMPVQQNKAIVGENAFRHRSGIHQDGMIKGGRYEIMNPEEVGWSGEGYSLTARSGYAGVGLRLRRLGYNISDEDVKKIIMPNFKNLADEKRSIGDTDLVYLMDSRNTEQDYRLEFVDLGSVSKIEGSEDYFASVVINVDGNEMSSKDVSGNGKHHEGSIDAIFSAIDQVVDRREGLHLVHYDPINLGTGREAIAEVTVILSENEKFDGKIRPFKGMYVGIGTHQDTLRASAMAYVDALNKAMK